jgi:hypothetical protein
VTTDVHAFKQENGLLGSEQARTHESMTMKHAHAPHQPPFHVHIFTHRGSACSWFSANVGAWRVQQLLPHIGGYGGMQAWGTSTWGSRMKACTCARRCDNAHVHMRLVTQQWLHVHMYRQCVHNQLWPADLVHGVQSCVNDQTLPAACVMLTAPRKGAGALSPSLKKLSAAADCSAAEGAPAAAPACVGAFVELFCGCDFGAGCLEEDLPAAMLMMLRPPPMTAPSLWLNSPDLECNSVRDCAKAGALQMLLEGYKLVCILAQMSSPEVRLLGAPTVPKAGDSMVIAIQKRRTQFAANP